MLLAILGRETRLALAEIESITSSEALTPFGPNAALLKADIAPLLAGSPKVGEVIEQMPAAPWPLQSQHLKMALIEHINSLPIGKVTIGMSVYGADLKPKQVQELLIEVKKQLKSGGRSVRVVPNKEIILNAASVKHNKLTNPRGADFVYIEFGNKAILGRTTRVQDIDAFAQRDRDKPARDAKIGMLPPKLAKLMLSLAIHSPNYKSGWILDPFCGSGTVLLEASASGCLSYGTDNSQDMVDATTKNLDWLESIGMKRAEAAAELGDATDHQWKLKKPLSSVVSEAYLGPAVSKLPKPSELNKIKSEVNSLIKKSLKNLHEQLPKGTPIVLAIPAWHSKKDITRLPLVDEIEKLGYTRRDFEHVNGPLIYRRENQVVGREILVLERN